MDFLGSKVYDILFISIGYFVLSSFSGHEKPIFNEYQLDITNLKCISFDKKGGYVLDDSSNNYLLTLIDTNILIIDISKDSIIKKIKRPDNLTYDLNISFPNVNHFSIFSGYDPCVFWIYYEDKMHEYIMDPSETGFIVFRATVAQYFHKRGEVYFNILPNNCREYPKDKHYSWPAFAKLDINTGETKEVNIRASQKYWGTKLDIPYIYTSQASGKYLIISYSYDEDIIKYNTETNEIERIKINYPYNTLEPLKTSKLKGQEAKDAIQKSWTIDDSYLNAFYDEEEEIYYRVYKPGLPLQDHRGNYFSIDDKPAYLIQQKSGIPQFYQLPMGIFTLRYNWFYSPIYKTINYPLQNEIFEKSNKYFYTIYGISMYDF